jgi:hypothetical protein
MTARDAVDGNADADVRSADADCRRAAVGVDTAALLANAPILFRGVSTLVLRSVEQHAGSVLSGAIGVARAFVGEENDADGRCDLHAAREMTRALARDETVKVAFGTEVDSGVGSGHERHRVRASPHGHEAGVVSDPSATGSSGARVVS